MELTMDHIDFKIDNNKLNKLRRFKKLSSTMFWLYTIAYLIGWFYMIYRIGLNDFAVFFLMIAFGLIILWATVGWGIFLIESTIDDYNTEIIESSGIFDDATIFSLYEKRDTDLNHEVFMAINLRLETFYNTLVHAGIDANVMISYYDNKRNEIKKQQRIIDFNNKILELAEVEQT